LKKFRKRFILLALILLLFYPVKALLNEVEKSYRKPIKLTFSLPFSDRVSKKYNIPRNVPIESVYVAGRFSDWEVGSESFRLKKGVDGCWSLSLQLGKGRHPYKFVIIPKKDILPKWAAGKIWVKDKTASADEDDAFGGKNSVLIVRSVEGIREFLRFLFFLFIFGTVALTLFEYIFSKLMFVKTSLRYKLAIIFLAFLFLSDMFFIIYGSLQRKEIIKYSLTDKINMIHLFLMNKKVDFSKIGKKRELIKAKIALDGFFKQSALRQNYSGRSNNKQQITSISIVSKKGRLLLDSFEMSSKQFLFNIFANLEDLQNFRNKLVYNSFQEYVKSSSYATYKIFTFNQYDSFDKKMVKFWPKSDINRTKVKSRYFSGNSFYYPIFVNQQIVAFYMFTINGESYSSLLREMLHYNMLVLLFVIVFNFVIIHKIGGMILAPIKKLLAGINKVRNNEFGYDIEVNTGDEVDELARSYNYMRKQIFQTRSELKDYAKNLEDKVEQRAKELKKAYASIKEDLFLAQRIQENLLLKKMPPNEMIDIGVIYSPLNEVGGDFYDIFEVKQNKIRIFLADATGHGIQAALVTMLIKSEYEQVKTLADPVDIFNVLNHEFLSTYGNLTVFFTGIIVDIDLEKMTLRYISAGHPSQYLLVGKNYVCLDKRGKMIGVVNNLNCSAYTLDLNAKDKIVLFTDGIFEQFDPSFNEFGMKRLRDFLIAQKSRGFAGKSADEINHIIMDEVEQFKDVQERTDDMTLITLSIDKVAKKRGNR